MRELSLYNITITCIEIPEVLPPQCEENLCVFFAIEVGAILMEWLG